MSDQEKHSKEDKLLDKAFQEAFTEDTRSPIGDWKDFEQKWNAQKRTKRRGLYWWLFAGIIGVAGFGFWLFSTSKTESLPVKTQQNTFTTDKDTLGHENVKKSPSETDSNILSKEAINKSDREKKSTTDRAILQPTNAEPNTSLSEKNIAPKRERRGTSSSPSETKASIADIDSIKNQTPKAVEKVEAPSKATQHPDTAHLDETHIQYVVERDTILETDSVKISPRKLKKLMKEGKIK